LSAVERRIRIVLVEDHEIVREGLQLMLDREGAFVVCGTAATAEEGLARVRREKPDLCIVDIGMPGLSGIDAVRQILHIHAACRILVLTAHDEALYAPRAFRAGAHGFVCKHMPAQTILEAVRRVAGGEVYMSPGMQSEMLRSFAGTDQPSPVAGLSDRELEVIRLVGQGFSVAQIAEKLHRSPKTIDVHRQNVKQKLGMATSSELARFAAKWVEGGQ
jgi:DNA-binding NarL/FixJ family response regulator